MKLPIRSLLSVSLLAFIVGCSDAGAPDFQSVPEALQEEDVFVFGRPPSPEILATGTNSDPGWMEAHVSMLTEAGDLLSRLSESDERSASVEEVHERYTDLLNSDLSPEARWFVRAELASRILARLAPPDGEPEETNPDVLGVYTDMLVEDGNPSAHRLSDALRHLKGEWSDDRIRAAAARSAEAARDHLGEVCAECFSEARQSYALPEGSSASMVASGLQALETLVQ